MEYILLFSCKMAQTCLKVIVIHDFCEELINFVMHLRALFTFSPEFQLTTKILYQSIRMELRHKSRTSCIVPNKHYKPKLKQCKQDESSKFSHLASYDQAVFDFVSLQMTEMINLIIMYLYNTF